MDVFIILTVMMISWGSRYAKCLRFYTLNMYSLLMLICCSNHFPDAANAAGQDHTLTPLRDNDTEIKERAIFPTLGYTLESPGEVKKQRF